jgi:peptidoglycan/xylan/chitin deacetylase (PgdA/CDA1 family)
MKWWPQLRGFLRATFHLGLIVLPGWWALHTASTVQRTIAVLLILSGIALLVRAAFIYLPGFDPFFRVPWHGPWRGRRMAITFDDGPNGAATEAVLELFRRYGGKATFFMVGQSVDAQPELARRVAAEGHAVGSHTYTHQKLSRCSHAHAVEEVERGHAALIAAGVPDQRLFRAPHGLKTFALNRHLDRMGLRMIAWTAGVYDPDCPSGDVIADRAMRWLRPGTILLLHDGKMGCDRRPLLHALERILITCRERGLEVVTIPELLNYKTEAASS